ncbi:MAG: peptidoglycan editing factor PgeF [bacterium]
MFYFEEKENIKYFKSSILDDEGFTHAFSTRINNLNLRVEQNRKKICEILNLDHNQIIIPEQKHTDNIKIIKNLNDDISETDGIITAAPHLAVILLFADCVPIILYASKERVFGVIHAGWRGASKKIVSKAINIFYKDFNINPNTIKAAIGPAIGQCCYPVSIETAFELKKSINKNHDNIFISSKNSDFSFKVNVDLKKLNALQLFEAGVEKIDILDDCTSCKNSMFYSYRAEKGKTGRHGAIASLK